MPRVQAVEVPVGSLVAQAFSKIDFADAYQVSVPDADLESFARKFLTVRIGWIEALFKLRNRLVSIFGLKTSLEAPPLPPQKVTFEPGTNVAIFRVFQKNSQEILLGEDDKHLDFRFSLLLQGEGANAQAVISTVVHFNNWLGRAYFIPVAPFHKLIVRAILSRAAKA